MKSQKIRYAIQAFFLILVLLFSINHMAAEKGVTLLPTNPNIHSICPLGGVETIYTMVTQDTLVKKVHPSAIVLMWATLILTLLLGAAFCGWICPFGTIMEYFSRLGEKILKNRHNRIIPEKARPYLNAFKYVFLAIILYETALTGKLWFSEYDPYHTLFAIISDEITIVGYVILAVTLLANIIEERFWCKYVCPLGAILGIFNKFSLFKIHRNKTNCIDCTQCNRQCPSGIDVKNTLSVTSALCTRCGKCITACPAKADTLEYQFGKFTEVKE